MYLNLKYVLQIGWLKYCEVLVHRSQMVDTQKIELLVVIVQVEVMVDEEYLVVEREVVEYLVVEHLL